MMVFEKVVMKYYVWSLNHSYLPYVFDNECTVDMGGKSECAIFMFLPQMKFLWNSVHMVWLREDNDM